MQEVANPLRARACGLVSSVRKRESVAAVAQLSELAREAEVYCALCLKDDP